MNCPVYAPIRKIALPSLAGWFCLMILSGCQYSDDAERPIVSRGPIQRRALATRIDRRGDEQEGLWAQRLARAYAYWASPQVHHLSRDRERILSRIQSLPPYSPQMNLGAGFHSAFAESQESKRWVQVDLGRATKIDTIALIPAYVRRDDANVAGYGFPRQFYVEVSDDPTFQSAARVFESLDDIPNPGKYPFLIRDIKATGRFIRVTCTKLAMDGDHAFFALGELIALSGPRNVALWRPLSSPDSVEAELRWSIEYLVDDISALPLPTYRQLSPTDGYQSRAYEQVDVDLEIVVDLQELRNVEEVCLVPALPLNRPDIPGWGFPREFRVELLESLDSKATVIYDTTDREFRHWLHRPLAIPVASREYFLKEPKATLTGEPDWSSASAPVPARYVRIKVSRLDGRIKPYHLALAEIQVFANNENAALEKPVSARDLASTEAPKKEDIDVDRWNASFLTDGFGSRRRLMSLPLWLEELGELKELESRASGIEAEFETAVDRVWSWHLWSVALMMSTALVSVVVYNRRLRQRHRRHAERLRNQIASDLHDDIGSNLGTIGLLCDSVAKGELSENELRALQDIREIATETSDAMRDILWIIDPASTRLEDFVGRLRGVSKRLLTNQESVFDSPNGIPEWEIPLPWRRNVFLSVKEVLHNAAKHSQSSRVEISVSISQGQFRMRIIDNGVGFQVESRKRGFGIRNVKRRIKELGGVVNYDSAPDKGTTVELNAPLPIPLPSS